MDQFWPQGIFRQIIAKIKNPFIDLALYAPEIRISARYATHENFVGKPWVGYRKPKILITKKAADALKKAQIITKTLGYDLVVYDGYRPSIAVDFLIKWAHNAEDVRLKQWYYPSMTKEQILENGYIVSPSAHSSGSTVDLTLIKSDTVIQKIIPHKRILQNGKMVYFLDDGTVDMGTSLDLFDQASRTESTLVTPEQHHMRLLLRTIMHEVGFVNLPYEWWHYTLANEPFPKTYFSFPIE